MAGVLFGPGRVHETGRKYNPLPWSRSYWKNIGS